MLRSLDKLDVLTMPVKLSCNKISLSVFKTQQTAYRPHRWFLMNTVLVATLRCFDLNSEKVAREQFSLQNDLIQSRGMNFRSLLS